MNLLTCEFGTGADDSWWLGADWVGVRTGPHLVVLWVVSSRRSKYLGAVPPPPPLSEHLQLERQASAQQQQQHMSSMLSEAWGCCGIEAVPTAVIRLGETLSTLHRSLTQEVL